MEMRFGGPNDPALVLDPGDADVRYILMPLRV
jgi:DNA polymerase-3 subunit beta